MRKFIITAELRDLEKQVSLGEISYSRMIELLNEKADKWYHSKFRELNKDQVCRFHSCNAPRVAGGVGCIEHNPLIVQ